MYLIHSNVVANTLTFYHLPTLIIDTYSYSYWDLIRDIENVFGSKLYGTLLLVSR